MGTAQQSTRQSKQNAWTLPLNSIPNVTSAIKHLNMECPSQDSLLFLSGNPLSPSFKKALTACLGVDGATPSERERQMVFGIVSCLSDSMLDSIEELKFTTLPPKELLLAIGADNGVAFTKAIKSALDVNSDNSDLGLTTVINLLDSTARKLGIPYRPSRSVSLSEAPANQPEHDAAEHEQHQEQGGVDDFQVTDDVPDSAIDPDSKQYLSTHVYGKTSTFCFNACKTQDEKHYAIMLDAALKVKESSDWKNAIHIQLTHKELRLLFAVLMGWKNAVKFSGHGKEHDKSFEIERQEGHLFAKVTGKGLPARALPITPLDVGILSDIVFAQILHESPLKANPDIVMSIIQATHTITLNK